MNLIRGRVSTAEPFVFIADGADGTSLTGGTELIYGIRPEHLTIGHGPITAEIVLIEPTGAETQVTTMLGSDQLVASMRERVDLYAGDNLVMMPDLGKVHLFDAKTEERLPACSVRPKA
jgi:multiple sugar transport system ATP-binding protein